ncbi:hypothetical protein WMY93_023315 [Mugilogobius chulae]|uniref:RecQ-like DNA helicase BLM N-terminal domain-containing protein n=1 Tax=Mugilogobius chulae TaxID=88201 RepID=A0AAW0N9I3_9GOBI
MAGLPQNNLLEQLAKHSSTNQSKLSLAKPKVGGFSFKKKSLTGTTKVEIPAKPVKSQNVKINNFFTSSSKSKSEPSPSTLQPTDPRPSVLDASYLSQWMTGMILMILNLLLKQRPALKYLDKGALLLLP